MDHESQVFRICRVPSRLQTAESPASLASPAPSIVSHSSATSAPEAKRSGKASFRSIKSAVRRPANAFILFRKDRHPELKKKNPTLHNNDISIILGKEWKNASEEVRAAYKARAQSIKQQHALDNPGYQYAPRKPGEKKRRMTKKKLARTRSANPTNDVAEMNGVTPSDLDSADDMPKFRSTSLPQTAENHIGAQRSPHFSHASVNNMGNLEVTLPSNNPNIFSEVRRYQHQHASYATTPFNSGSAAQVLSSVPQYTQNDDAFLNSLIDWQGIANDNAVLNEATPDELAELHQLSLAERTESTSFDEEIARIMALL